MNYKLLAITTSFLLLIGCQSVKENIETPQYSGENAFVMSQSKLPGKLAKVIPMLKQKNYEYVENYYTDLLKEYQNNPTQEALLVLSFDLIKNTEEDIISEIDDYLLTYKYEKNNDSYVAHLLRGLHYQNAGWYFRGSKFRSETSAKQIENMEKYFKIALDEFDIAIKIYPNDVYARANKIDILRNYKKRTNELESVYKDAIKINPLSYLARSYYMSSIVPKWGGSIEQMKSTLLEANNYVPENDKLVYLVCWLYNVEMEYYAQNQQPDKSLDSLFLAANNSFGYYQAYYLELLGDTFYHKGEFYKALDFYAKAVELRPTNIKYVKRYIWMKNEMKKERKERKEKEGNSNSALLAHR